jgi:hypothetical protein
MTNDSHLLEDRGIQREPAARWEVNQQLAAARRDLETARGLLGAEMSEHTTSPTTRCYLQGELSCSLTDTESPPGSNTRGNGARQVNMSVIDGYAGNVVK